eukprot:g4615.t1
MRAATIVFAWIVTIVCLKDRKSYTSQGQHVGKEGDEYASMVEKRFLGWLNDKGLPEHSLEIKWFDGAMEGQRYRGLITTKDVEMGDKILQIPKRFLLTSNDQQTPISSVLNRLRDALPKRIVIALKLLYLLATDDPFWKPFLDFVAGDAKNSIVRGTYEAKETDTSLLFYTEEELAELQCPSFQSCPVLEKLRRTKIELSTVWKTIEEPLRPHFPDGALTYNNFLWSYATVSSRAFSINVTAAHGFALLSSDDEDGYRHLGGVGNDPTTNPTRDGAAVLSYIMAPFAGLLNHHNSVPALQFTYGFNDKDESLEIFADQDYAAGEQVYISYGILTNPDLMLNYGFVLPNNVYETVGLSFEPADQSKMEEIARHGLGPHTKTHVSLTGDPSHEFIAAMRVNNHISPGRVEETPRSGASSASSPPPVESESSLTNPFRPISSASEFEMFQSLLLNVEQLLRTYPTTLRDDLRRVRLLSSSEALDMDDDDGPSTVEGASLTPRAAQALIFRIEMKRILHATILRCLRGIESAFRVVETDQRANATDPSSPSSERATAMWKHWDRGMVRWNETWTSWVDTIDNIWAHTGSKTAREYVVEAFSEAINDGLDAMGLNVTDDGPIDMEERAARARRVMNSVRESTMRQCQLDGSCDPVPRGDRDLPSPNSIVENESPEPPLEALGSMTTEELESLRSHIEKMLQNP